MAPVVNSELHDKAVSLGNIDTFVGSVKRWAGRTDIARIPQRVQCYSEKHERENGIRSQHFAVMTFRSTPMKSLLREGRVHPLKTRRKQWCQLRDEYRGQTFKLELSGRQSKALGSGVSVNGPWRLVTVAQL